VLKQAAVLGRSIDPRVLRLATELEEDRLLTALEDAERAQLITPSENGQGSAFLFAHALIPSTLVEGLRIVERRRLHQRAAAAVEQIDPDASGRLAHHYLESGQQARGIEHLLRAGNEARLMHAHQEAIRCYRQAIDHFLGSGDHRSAGSALFRLALAYHNAFEFEAARTTYDQAFASLQRAASARSTGAIQASPHPLRLASGNPVTLDPSLSGDIRSNLLVHQLFSGLVEERPDAGLVPDIASSWEVTEGGTKYLFHLRPDARWSDGEPVLSTDFVYAWRRCLEPGAGSPLASLLYDIKGAKAFHEGRLSDEDRLGIRAPDPHSLIVELDQPANYFLSILSTPTAFPLPLRAIEAHGEAWTEPEHIVTNGPFRLRSWTKGESMSLERWRGYSGEFSGNVDRLDLRLYEGSADHLLAVYEANQLDALTLTEMTSDQHEAARQRLADQYVSIPVLSTSFVIFDNRRPPFADRRVRLAFAQAVDRERLADVALRGHQFPAKGSFVPPGIPGHFDDVVVRHDPDNSRQLLARAGFPGGTSFPIIDTFAPMEFSEVFGANELSRQWEEELGVRINVKEIPWTEFVTRMRDDPPRLGFGGWWADYPDPYNFLHLAGFGGYIVTSWHDDQYESLVQRGKMTSELEDRLDCYRRAEAILAEELPLFPVLHGRMHFLIKPWVSSFPTSPSRYWFFKDVVIEPH
jgi:oligopeptide transport system substrate-binding protein